jgi:chromate transporter
LRATRVILAQGSLIRTHPSELREVATLFFKLGVIGVGGPAAHVALMRDEVVRRRGWLSDEEFLDLLGAVNLLPGPNSTELAIHIGRRRAGVAGLIVAGLCFILPAMVLVLACAWAYVRFGRVPAVVGAWAGAKPVVIAIVAVALWGFGRTALRPVGTLAAGAVGLALAIAGVHELVILLAAGLVTLLLRIPSWRPRAVPALMAVPWAVAAAPPAPSLDWLFLYFFKIGSVLYGSGYVLLSFLRNGLVERTGLLSEGQLLDAVAVGQLTPGPVFTTATFVGYLLRGLPGGVLATVGIFLPAFLLVGASGALVPWIRRTPAPRAFLDGVNAGAVSLMAVVSWTLARGVLTTAVSWWLVIIGLGLVMAGVNSAWLVAGGALVGLLLR